MRLHKVTAEKKYMRVASRRNADSEQKAMWLTPAPDTFDHGSIFDALHRSKMWHETGNACIGFFDMFMRPVRAWLVCYVTLVKTARLEFRSSHSPLMLDLPTAP